MQFRRSHVVSFGITIALATVGMFAPGALVASAQGDGGSVCVIAYEDANRNGVREPDEPILQNVNINLAITSNVLVANHVIDGPQPYCFQNIPAQQYTVSIDSPLYVPVEPSAVAFDLQAGRRQTFEFGAVPRPEEPFVDPNASIIVVPLTLPVRLAIAALTSVVVMALLGGLGMVIYGLFFHRRRQPDADLPEWVQEPQWDELRTALTTQQAPVQTKDDRAIGYFDDDFDDPYNYNRR